MKTTLSNPARMASNTRYSIRIFPSSLSGFQLLQSAEAAAHPGRQDNQGWSFIFFHR